jgi:hypothetical protein
VLVASRHRHGRPTHETHDRRLRHAEDQQSRRGCVTGVVQPSADKEPLPLVIVGARVDRLAGRGGEDVAGVPPELSCCRPLRILRLPVRIGTGFGLPAPEAFWYSPTAFGFLGFGGSLGFADPATGLAFGYAMNHIQEGVPDPGAANLVNAVQNAMKAHTP